MKKILLYVGLVGIAGMVESSAGGGAVASSGQRTVKQVIVPLQEPVITEQEYRDILKRWDLEENVTMLDIFNKNKYLSMHTFKKLEEDLEKVENYNKQVRFNDEIAKRWLKVGINTIQQNIDLSKNPINWNQFEKDSNRYISSDPEFIKKHYQGVLAFIAKEGYDKLIQGRCLCLDSTNTTEVTTQLQTQLYQDIVTHISVYAADVSSGSNVWNAIEFIFQQRSDLTLIVNFEHNSQTNNFRVPYSIKRLVVSGRNITSIEERFLYACSGLTQLDVSLSNVTSVGDTFLSGCSGLTQLDLSPLSNVKEIGGGFLARCSGLTQLDLSSLSKVNSVRTYFLFKCSGLTQLDLSPLSNITQIGSAFLYGCSGLTQLDLSPLSNVTSVGDTFLSGCSGLTQLDLSPLRNITQIGRWFLCSCSGIKELDLSLLSNITQIGEWFLSNCSGIKELDLSLLSNITIIKKGFLDGCTRLIKLKFPNITSIKINKLNFLAHCHNLEQIHIHKQLYEELGGATYFNNKRFPKLKGVHFYNEELQEQQRAGSGAVAINNISTETLGKLSKKQMKKNKKK